MGDAAGELGRRRFLERMTALTATAMLAPASLRDPVAGVAAPATGSPAAWTLPARTPIQATELDELTLAESVQLLREGAVSSEELARARIDRIEQWDGTYRAFNTVLAERALERAREAAPPGPHAPLAGIPLAIKDNFYTAGVRTTANSHLFADFVPAFDATAWARLRAAGGILLGKTQMGPLATTAATTPDGERTTVNAWSPFDASVSPGGSSSGSATAVASRMAPCGTGTQTGGSITNPSGAQGLTGIKPTMGRVSLHGILPLTYTRDHVGPLARDARDAAMMLQVMAGPDPADPRSLGLPPVPDLVLATEPGRTARELAGLRIGVWPGYLDGPPVSPGAGRGDDDPEARRGGAGGERERRAGARSAAQTAARREMLDTLHALGADLVEIDAPDGWDARTSAALNNVRLPERSEIFLEHLRRDVRGFGVSLPAWINGLMLPAAEYVRGQRARLMLLRSILDDVFGRCDVVLQTGPIPFDMVGLPLITFPIGFESASTAGPRPIGALFGGAPYAEARLLRLAAAFQRATDWHRRRPADPGAFPRPDPDEGPGRIDVMDVMDLCE